MLKEFKERGYKDGLESGKENKKSGMKPKDIIDRIIIDDKKLAKQIMKDTGMNHDKSFRMAIAYSFAFDRGVREAIFSND